PGAGVSPIDAVLADEAFMDPLTAEIITTADVFADFVVANVFNAPFGDGRFVHRFHELPEDQGPAGQIISDSLDFSTTNQAVNQYGTVYYYVGGQTGTFTLTFDGQPVTLRLPFEASRSPEDRYYWSGSEGDSDHRLTRAFDLRGTESATLTFDSWYDLESNWNYAYTSISTDNGATWEIVPLDGDSSVNRLGLAYGPGLTGLSSATGPRPFPFIGVQFDSDGMTVTGIVEDGPASQTDLQVGDQIIGYNETPWPGQPAILQVLATYEAGDTFDMYVQRGGDRLTIPIVLGEHPERVIMPDPEWVTHSADLTPYAGQNILLRFEYISMLNHENPGIAIDNISIPEINYRDDAESGSDWTFQGWEWSDNLVRQNFLVQMISSGNETTPPATRQLIGPAEDATSGQWRFTLQPNQILVFAVSGLNDNTDLPGVFDLTLQDTSGDAS
ncbi:MAG: immune inhibitor A, partial [Anaerolineae bacterium]|nr:immune inhibitor A [Anaerolineae bacterium]